MKSNIIQVAVKSGHETLVNGIYQYDHGIKLSLSGLVPDRVIEVQFAVDGQRTSIGVVANYSAGNYLVEVPDVLLLQDRPVWAYVYVEEDAGGHTTHAQKILLIPRAKPQDFTATPEQIDNYNNLIAELNALISNFPQITDETNEIHILETSDVDTTLTQAGKVAEAKAVGDKIGDLQQLKTASKDNLVEAINDIATAVAGNPADPSAHDIYDLLTTDATTWSSKKIDEEISSVRDTLSSNENKIGTLSDLPTEDKSSLVAAIIELQENIENIEVSGGGSGEDGADGEDGKDGKDGEDGGYYVPTVSNGTLAWSASKSGMPAIPSSKISGSDGVSPTVEITETEDGHTVTIKDASGSHSFDVLNGKDGEDGEDGESSDIITNGDEVSVSTAWSSAKVSKKLAAVNSDIDSLEASIEALGGTVETLPSVEAWGDSLTLGAGAAQYSIDGKGQEYEGCFTRQLATLIQNAASTKDVTVMNYGVGQETIETILGRLGTYPMMVMPLETGSDDGDSGDSIEASIVISQQPQNVYAVTGSTVTFSVVASNVATYQWQFCKFNDTKWSNSGSTGFNTDSVKVAVTADSYRTYWRCLLTDSSGNTMVTNYVEILQADDIATPAAVDYWHGHKDPLTYTTVESSWFGYNGDFPLSGGNLYMYACPVEAGSLYRFSSWSNSVVDSDVRVRKLCFTTEKPIVTLTAITANIVSIPEDYEYRTAGSNSHSLYNAGTFLVPPGATYIVFAIEDKNVNKWIQGGAEYTLQKVANADAEPTYPAMPNYSASLIADSRAVTVQTPIQIGMSPARVSLSAGIQSIMGKAVTPLRQCTDAKKGVNACEVDGLSCTIGGIPGKLEYVDTGYCFTRSATGAPLTIDRPYPIVTAAMQDHRKNKVVILWMGQNNTITRNAGESDDSFNARLEELTQYMIEVHQATIDYLKTDKYLILSAPIIDLSATTADIFKPLYARMQQKFGSKYINVVDYLIHYGIVDANLGYSEKWAAQEAQDVQDYKIPYRLRGEDYDDKGNSTHSNVHLSANGYGVVARQVYQRGQMLGYWK